MSNERFSRGTSKIAKRAAGRTILSRTPVVIRSPDPLGEGFERRIRSQLARRIGRAAGMIERITVRFEDVNGPKGGVDTVCRIKVVISGRPSIIVEKQTHSHATAFARAAAALGTAVTREQRTHGLHTGRRPAPSPSPRTTRATVALEDSRTHPSRKSTRRSMKERAAVTRLTSSQARLNRRG